LFPKEFLQPGGRADHVYAGAGPDEIRLRDDGRVDVIRCGAGHDVVTYLGGRDRLDSLSGCERVTVR
jgi:hypothetical protein